MMSCTLMSNTVPSGTTERLFNNTRKHRNGLRDIYYQFKITFLLRKTIFLVSLLQAGDF